MDINLFFEKVVKEFNLGTLTEGPIRVSGGFTHRMFKVSTDKGRYIVKLLNPNIMRRPTAIENFDRADKIEEILKENHISAIFSLKFNGKKRQLLNGQYFYIYEWFDGKTLKDGEITKFHCEKIGNVLAKIHNIDLKKESHELQEKNIDFKYYINLAKEKDSPIYKWIYDKLDILKDSMTKGNKAIQNLPSIKAICHNDLDSKNVMWLNDDYKIIDLECLEYSNPYLELYELALCWSGYEKCNINFELFETFLRTYFNHSDLDTNIDWESLYYANNGRLEWLEFNIKRSLMIECNTKEEQELGINEVKETMKHIVYYDKVKNEILEHISNIIGVKNE